MLAITTCSFNMGFNLGWVLDPAGATLDPLTIYNNQMGIGIYTFERTPDARSGQLVTAEQRLRDLMHSIELLGKVVAPAVKRALAV